MKNKYLKIGVVFGVMILAFVSMVQVVLFHHYEMAYFIEDMEGSIAGGTLLSVLLMSYSKRSKNIIEREVKIELNENESILRWDVANFMRDGKRCNGKLVLTAERILFKSLECKDEKRMLELAIADVTKVEVEKTAGILLNLLSVEECAKEKMFMLDDPKAWKTDILKLMN